MNQEPEPRIAKARIDQAILQVDLRQDYFCQIDLQLTRQEEGGEG